MTQRNAEKEVFIKTPLLCLSLRFLGVSATLRTKRCSPLFRRHKFNQTGIDALSTSTLAAVDGDRIHADFQSSLGFI